MSRYPVSKILAFVFAFVGLFSLTIAAFGIGVSLTKHSGGLFFGLTISLLFVWAGLVSLFAAEMLKVLPEIAENTRELVNYRKNRQLDTKT